MSTTLVINTVSLSHGTAHVGPSVLLNPESQDVAAALALFGAKVLPAVAFKSGTLRLVFDIGHHLTCSSDPSFEGWQVAGPTTSPSGPAQERGSLSRGTRCGRHETCCLSQRAESTRLTQPNPCRSAAHGRLTSMRQDTATASSPITP
ncbi:DUF6188 family protein [Streptomyces sp. Tue6028]|uniref:DUF6188 family protein n=1 Tax=Streptomyces sp. Tue6028 TaxID=2036037 RepID=UPI003D749F46